MMDLVGMAKPRADKGRQVLKLVDLARIDLAPGVDPDSSGSDSSETFETFYRREFPRLVALARALAGPSQASDVAQETMLVVLRRWETVRYYGSPAGWARVVCSHKAVSALRRKALEARTLARLRLRPSTMTPPASDADELFWQEVRRLPRRQAQVVALFYAVDLSVADIAVTLDCAEGTVKAHLHRARMNLAARLEPGAGAQT